MRHAVIYGRWTYSLETCFLSKLTGPKMKGVNHGEDAQGVVIILQRTFIWFIIKHKTTHQINKTNTYNLFTLFG